MKKLLNKCDKVLLILVLIYCVIGLLMVFSASSVSSVLQYKVNPYYYFIKQGIFILVALFVGFYFILKIPTSKYRFFLPVALVALIASLAGLFIYGNLTNNVLSWYRVGPISIQPSEFAKTILIIYLGTFFYKNQNNENKTIFIKPLIVCVSVIFLVLLQPDFGTAAIIGGICFFIFLSVPVSNKGKFKIFEIIMGAVIISAIVFLYSDANLLNSEQLSRFQFKDPCTRYTEKTGYQVCNGFIAMNNGGLFGKGLGNSTQKYLYLPEGHTDFIFAIIVEELGSVFGALLIIGYFYILLRILKIAKKANNIRNSILAYGAFLYILFHLLVNFMGILAIIPLTGVPLPFLSYGGSFNANILAIIFIVERVKIESEEARLQKELQKL